MVESLKRRMQVKEENWRWAIAVAIELLGMLERRESIQVKQTMSDMMYFLVNDKFIERAIEECGTLLNPPPSFSPFREFAAL
nr:hypothetical transcript [Hymenolepis microstoma]CDS35371.1 hypothetical transcript [Hymenolepis microstoma]